MAEEEVQEDNTAEDEAEALERLLQEEGAKEEDAGGEEEAGGKNKKLILILAVGAVLVFGGVAVFLFSGPEEEVPPPLEELQTETEQPAEEGEARTPDGVQNLDIPKVYALEPFFLPLKNKKKETGQFIYVRVGLQMSNKKLGGEIERVLPLVRQTIFEILSRKRPKDFDNKRKPIKDRLKREIITSTNTLLLSGSGKIDDVFFSEFMLR